MTTATMPADKLLDPEDGVLLRLLALALAGPLARVQRRRRKPAKKGRLHRV